VDSCFSLFSRKKKRISNQEPRKVHLAFTLSGVNLISSKGERKRKNAVPSPTSVPVDGEKKEGKGK